MDESTNPRPVWMLGIIVIALLAIVGVRFWTPQPDIPAGVPLSSLGTVRMGGEWNAPENHVFASELVVDLGTPRSFQFLDISLDNNDTYRLERASDKGFLPFHTIEPASGIGLARREIRFGKPIPTTTQLRIVAVSGDGMYSLGHLIIQ